MAVDERLLYLARHGEHELADGPRRYIGQLDVPLSAEGARQAGGLGRMLTRAELTAIFCSDLQRARRTAEIVAQRRCAAGQPALQPQARADLREISLGAWEGLTQDEVRRRYPGEFQARGENLAGYRPPGGESFAECGRRVLTALEAILASTQGNVLVVAHAGVNLTLFCHWLGMPLQNLFRIRQDYGCLNLIAHGGSGYRILMLNQTARSLP